MILYIIIITEKLIHNSPCCKK